MQLVEASPGLMALQANALSAALETANARMVPAGEEAQLQPGVKGVECEWFPRIEAVPVRANVWTMGVAHEFFDALPIHIFEVSRQRSGSHARRRAHAVLARTRRKRQRDSGKSWWTWSATQLANQA